RFRASYVTVWNVGEYGIYVEDGEHGRVDHAYVSGAARAAYYVGECRPCDAKIANVVARLSAIGYSGTNATGVEIRNSTWDRNGAGIVPNTYANEALPPQEHATIMRNTITQSGRAAVPSRLLWRASSASASRSRAATGTSSPRIGSREASATASPSSPPHASSTSRAVPSPGHPGALGATRSG